jgi:hypothetical protein
MIDRRQPPPTLIGYLDQPPASIPLNRLPIPMIMLGLDGDLGYADPACARVLGPACPTTVSSRTLPALLAGHPHLTPGACVNHPARPGR